MPMGVYYLKCLMFVQVVFDIQVVSSMRDSLHNPSCGVGNKQYGEE